MPCPPRRALAATGPGSIAEQAVTQYEWIGAKDMIGGLWESLLAVGLWLPPLDSNQ